MYGGIFFWVKVAILLFKSNFLCFMGNKHAQLTLLTKWTRQQRHSTHPNLKLEITQQFTFLLYLTVLGNQSVCLEKLPDNANKSPTEWLSVFLRRVWCYLFAICCRGTWWWNSTISNIPCFTSHMFCFFTIT